MPCSCDDDLVPISEAPEYLNDEEWVEQVGEETAEELRDAYEEWKDAGRPAPPPGYGDA